MESTQFHLGDQYVMHPRALLAAVAGLITIFLIGCEQEHSAPRANDLGTATGESWICATVGDADFESWQPIEPIEGLTLHFEAQMVLEREIYEKGLPQYILRTNVGPVYIKRKSEEIMTLSTGHRPPLPPGFGEWGMMERVAPGDQSITPYFYDTDGKLHMLSIDILEGDGCSLEKSDQALCFEGCTAAQVTVPIIKPAHDPR
jgi:hypothetical protein